MIIARLISKLRAALQTLWWPKELVSDQLSVIYSCWKIQEFSITSRINILDKTRDKISYPGGSDCRESACKMGDLGSIPGWGKDSIPGGGHGNPLQYFCLENLHGQSSLAGYHPRGHKESDMTEWLSTAHRDKIYTIVINAAMWWFPHFSKHIIIEDFTIGRKWEAYEQGMFKPRAVLCAQSLQLCPTLWP